MTFKPGDLVRLKSGGPYMVVQDDSEIRQRRPGMTFVAWFAGDDIKTHWFDPAALTTEGVTIADRQHRREIVSGLPPCQGNCTDHDGGCGKPDCVWNET